MRLQELFETTEEDRALISLGDAIYKYLQKYADQDLDYDNPDDEREEMIRVGKIGNLFDTPIKGMQDIKIEIQSDAEIEKRLQTDNPSDAVSIPGTGAPGGVWYNHNKTIILNSDYLSSNYMKSVIVHELRHAMDDIKSGYKAGTSQRYETPKKKEFRKATKDPYLGNMRYIASPGEINARFAQVLHGLVDPIRRAAKLESQTANKLIFGELNKLLTQHRIEELFPEREKSKDYKRLIKRAVDFIEKEVKYAKEEQAKQPSEQK